MSKSFREQSPRNFKSSKSHSTRTFKTAQSSRSSSESESADLEDKAIKEHELVTPQADFTQKQKPSVADLRKSFEKISQPSTSNLNTPSQSKLQSKPSIQRSPKRSQDCVRSSDCLKQPKALEPESRTQRSNDTLQIQSNPLLRTRPVALKSKGLDPLESTSSTTLPVNSSPGFLFKSSRFRQRRTLIPTSNTSGEFVSFTPAPIKADLGEHGQRQCTESFGTPAGAAGKGHVYDSPTQPYFLSSPMKSPKHTVAGQPRTPAGASMLSKSHATPRPSAKSEPVTRRSTKVSDLRRLFDRPSIRGASPIPFMTFRRSRGRTAPLAEPDLKLFSTESFATLSTQATFQKRVPAPELTTEISINDFACNFADKPEHLGTKVSELEYDGPAGPELSVKKESPVKERIDRFERLDCGSPSTKTIPYGRAKSYDTSLRLAFGNGEKYTDKNRFVGGWRPIRERGTAMWRRISSSFGYSLDGSDGSGNDNQQIDSEPRRLGSQLRYRRSSIFGYHLYRSTETEHNTTYSSYGGSSDNIDDIPMAKLENRPSCVSYTSSSPRQVPVRKSFPLLGRRISNRIRLSSGFDFGLDGALSTKVARDDDDSLSEGIPRAPDPSAPRSDSQALSNAMSKQSAAERWHRKQEEKRLCRGQKAKRKEGPIYAKSKWKGKEKARAVTDSETEEHDVDQAHRNDKGKGKEVEGETKDKTGREGSWSKKTASGFVVHQATDLKLRHPKPRRPGQVKKIVNMYKEKASSGIKIAAKAASQHSVNKSNTKGGGSGSSIA